MPYAEGLLGAHLRFIVHIFIRALVIEESVLQAPRALHRRQQDVRHLLHPRRIVPLAGGAPVDVGLLEVRLLAEVGGPVLAADAAPQDLLVLEAARFPRRGENVPNRLGESLRVMLRMICEEVFQRCRV